jgi:hypothetical protein
VNYPRSEAEVVMDVDAALATANRTTMLNLGTELDNDNNLGCPLNRSPRRRRRFRPGGPQWFAGPLHSGSSFSSR